jgi:hypothetical protein
MTILALIGQYITLQQTKAENETRDTVAEKVDGKADEELAKELASTQTNLEDVLRYCRGVAEKSRERDEKQDDTLMDVRKLVRRSAYGLDDLRFTIQVLHPKRPAANFKPEETFVEATEELEEEYEPTEDIIAPEPPAAIFRNIDSTKIKNLRKEKKEALQMAE